MAKIGAMMTMVATWIVCALPTSCGDGAGTSKADASIPADAPPADRALSDLREIPDVETTRPDSTADAARPDAGQDSFRPDVIRFPNDSVKPLGALTTDEKKALCDQVAADQGGYGRIVSCDAGTQTTDSSQGSCVLGIPTIAAMCSTLTVGDVVGCSAATGPDLCKFSTAAACSAVFACLN